MRCERIVLVPMKMPTASPDVNSPLQAARVRLAIAQSSVQTAKIESRAAKRRRKEAKQAALRAKKRLKKAKQELAEARHVFAEAEQMEARAVKAPVRTKRATKIRIAKPVATRRRRKTSSKPRIQVAPAAETVAPDVVSSTTNGEPGPVEVEVVTGNGHAVEQEDTRIGTENAGLLQ